MEISEVSFYDFDKAMDKLKEFENMNFDYMTMSEVQTLIDYASSVTSEWRYLKDDIEEWFRILKNIEEE